MRLIDADALKADCDIYNSWDAQIVKAWLDDQPTIEERKTGRWIPVINGRGGHECDKCHNYAPSYQCGDEYLSDYCPHCGAKMEVEHDSV